MRLTIDHADTCLPDFWSGSHKAHVSVPVTRNMSAEELRRAIKSEINQGAFAGSDTRTRDAHPDHAEFLAACRTAVDEMEINPGPLFYNLEPTPDDDCCAMVVAIFTFEDAPE